MEYRRVHFSDEVETSNKGKDDMRKLVEPKFNLVLVSTGGRDQENPTTHSTEDDVKADTQPETHKKVRFASQVQYYEVVVDYTAQKKFFESLWKKFHEISKYIQKLSGLQVKNDYKKLEEALESITDKLEQQIKHVGSWSKQISSQATSSITHTIASTEDEEEVIGSMKELIIQKEERGPCTAEHRMKLFQETAITDTQRKVLSSTDDQSSARIKTEHEIVHKEMNKLASEAVQNHRWVARQLTNDNTAATCLIESIKKKAEDENQKWFEVAQRLGQNKADKMRARVAEIDGSITRWRKERQRRLKLATKLMATVDKEKSVKIRTEMVGKRPDLSREVVIVEAAKMVSGIKRILPHCDVEAVLDEQEQILTTKLTKQQAREVIAEVYRTLDGEKCNYK